VVTRARVSLMRRRGNGAFPIENNHDRSGFPTSVTGHVQELDEAQEPDEGHMNSSGFFFFRSG